METTNEQQNESIIENVEKSRHGCVTAWLIFMIVVNSFTALMYLIAGEKITQQLPGGGSYTLTILLAICSILNVLFAVFLLKWKKWSFWGFLITSICVFIINLSLGLNIFQVLLGLIGVAILYGILQIKRNGISAWNNLD